MIYITIILIAFILYTFIIWHDVKAGEVELNPKIKKKINKWKHQTTLTITTLTKKLTNILNELNK